MEIAGGAVNVYRNGHAGQPIVLLSGLGTAAPALDFAPLIRELGDYDVIVVEGFGYGYSDLSASERTNKNISTELHEALGSSTLAGHMSWPGTRSPVSTCSTTPTDTRRRYRP